MVALVLVGAGGGECGDGLVEDVGAAEIGGDGDPVPGARGRGPASTRISPRRSACRAVYQGLDAMEYFQSRSWRNASHMLPAQGNRIRPTDPLKPGRDLAVIQVGIVTAVAADDLQHAGVTAIRMPGHNAGRLAPEKHRPVPRGGLFRAVGPNKLAPMKMPFIVQASVATGDWAGLRG